MATQNQRLDQGRAARAADLIVTLLDQLPLAHPARETARELQTLFNKPTSEVRELLEKVPGKSLAQKAAAVGLSRGTLWSIWKQRYRPNAEVMARIRTAAGEAPE